MAKVTSVILTFGNLEGDLQSVEVKYTITFSPEEAGVRFKVTIGLFESPPDFPSFLVPPTPVYTFANKSIVFLQARPYFMITATPGEKTYTVSQQAPRDVLNVNPKTFEEGGSEGLPILDTLVAEVTIQRYEPVESGRSAPEQVLL